MTPPMMESLRLLLLFLHFLGLASLIGGLLVQIRKPQRRITPAILYGALTELVTGPLLIGIDTALDKAISEPKTGLKLLALLVITVLAFIFRRRATLAPIVFFVLLALSVFAVAVAVFWT
jgi:hypothetical protein